MATIPTDDRFTQQWHLRNTTEGEFDLNVVDAWDDYTGKGVKLVVIDSGIDYSHSDLAPNYDMAADYDYGQADQDAFPVGNNDAEHHGTAVAGLAVAAANGTGVVGVAYDATLIAYRIDYYAGSTNYAAQVGQAIRDAADNGHDTVNMSLGVGGYYDMSSAVLDVVESIQHAVETGRDGLGTILIMAGGNSRQSSGTQGQINGRTFDSRTEMISVAALDRDGTVSTYSSYGANNLVSAFGSPSQIVTTDRVGSAGYNATDFRETFNGTSAAAPQVTGITALMLEANDNLGWRDVQTILAYSARHVGSPIDGETLDGIEKYPWMFNAANNWNGGGLHYSQDYGYGLADARAAVRLAETWNEKSTSANQKIQAMDLVDQPTAVAQTDADGVTVSARVRQNIEIERVGIVADFQGQANKVSIFLTGPDGIEREFVSATGNGTTYSQIAFEFQSQEYRGVDSAGMWSVRIAYSGAQTMADAIFDDLRLKFYGSADSKNDTYIFTDEYSQFLDTRSKKLFDANGGTDLLNASAVTSRLKLDLDKGTGRIDGVDVRLKGIENAYGGDGADTIGGSKGSNDLAGGRGADTLKGGKGNDDFIFWHLRDSLVDAFDRILDFGNGKDRIDLGRIDANILTGRDDKFRFIGTKEFSDRAGELSYEKKSGRTLVEADVDGDGIADFMIELSGRHDLVKGEFML